MIPALLANGDVLPETFDFMRVGWWIVHLIAIPGIFFLGWAAAKAGKGAPTPSGKPPPPSGHKR